MNYHHHSRHYHELTLHRSWESSEKMLLNYHIITHDHHNHLKVEHGHKIIIVLKRACNAGGSGAALKKSSRPNNMIERTSGSTTTHQGLRIWVIFVGMDSNSDLIGNWSDVRNRKYVLSDRYHFSSPKTDLHIFIFMDLIVNQTALRHSDFYLLWPNSDNVMFNCLTFSVEPNSLLIGRAGINL